jgi:hypothetical protein
MASVPGFAVRRAMKLARLMAVRAAEPVTYEG